MKNDMHLPSSEEVAENLLEEAAISAPPVGLGEIAKYRPTLKVSFEELDNEGYLIDLGRVGSQMFINKNAKRERQRFTFAHELGHFLLAESGLPLTCSTINNREDSIERWCNQFASFLLMPKSWIVQELHEIPIERLHKSIAYLAQTYEVSNEAMQIRLAEIFHFSYFIVQINESDVKVINSITCAESPKAFFQYQRQICPHFFGNGSPRTVRLGGGKYATISPKVRSAKHSKWAVSIVESSDGVHVDLVDSARDRTKTAP